jgi:hypothetical protein
VIQSSPPLSLSFPGVGPREPHAGEPYQFDCMDLPKEVERCWRVLCGMRWFTVPQKILHDNRSECWNFTFAVHMQIQQPLTNMSVAWGGGLQENRAYLFTLFDADIPCGDVWHPVDNVAQAHLSRVLPPSPQQTVRAVTRWDPVYAPAHVVIGQF